MVKINKKKLLIRLGIAIAIFIVSFALITKFVAGSTKPAYLHIEKGTVEISHGSEFEPAVDSMELDKKDIVRTGADSKAIIVLYDSSFITLEENTEIEIASLSKANTKTNQNSGTTWNKFTKITGMSGYEVETPNTVATIRGTEFLIDAEEDKIIVVEGSVDYAYDGKTIQVNEFEKYVKGQKTELTAEENAMLISKIKEGIEIQKKIRHARMQRMRIVNWVRDNYEVEKGKNMTEDEQIDAFLDAVDTGEVDEKKLLKKVPLLQHHPVAKEFVEFNEEIKQQEERLRLLEGREKQEVEEIDIDITEDNTVVIEDEIKKAEKVNKINAEEITN